MKDSHKAILILISGFLQLGLSYIIPVGGGGISLSFVLTIPILVGLGILFSTIYYAFFRKIKSTLCKNGIFLGMLSIIIILTFISYPYK